MKKRSGLLTHFAIIFILFALVTTIATSVITYFVQMRTYRELCWDTIQQVDDYLTNLILEDGDDFLHYTKFYQEHYEDFRIPIDFDGYEDARTKFTDAYTHAYPDQTLFTDISVSDLPYDLQLLYYTYRHEYWLTTFEQARKSFDLPYTYFLTMKEDSYDVVYQIDGERTEDKEHPGYLYMADEYHNPPETHQLIWKTWSTGQVYDEVYEWDNAWGNTYSHYRPLIINGQKVGLVVAEVAVSRVNREILSSSVQLGIRIAEVFFFAILILLFMVNVKYISKLHYLAEKIERYASSRDENTVSDLRNYSFGKDEIGSLAEETANMIEEIENHQDELERAARMKTDFLANMSHEIRTPMNAVIGMAEMAQREEMSDPARNYLGQIKASGRILIAIINDILDFSKIESGELEILSGDYVPTSMFNDVSNIIMMRIGSKDIHMDLDLPPDLPAGLRGDSIRIRQILINLANNAVKFTEKGRVSIRVRYKYIEENTIMLTISVEDTGIGIKEEDLKKIFESFSQADSKRNRSADGTGLGLAISQRLISLMNGTLDVESTPGEGSVFTFSIPQTVVDRTPSMAAEKPDKCVALSLLSDETVREGLKRDSIRLGVSTLTLPVDVDLGPRIREIQYQYPGDEIFLFTDASQLTPDRMQFLESTPEIIVVLVTDFNERSDINLPNMVQIKKPLSVMNVSMVYNHEKILFDISRSDDKSEYIAPDASVLIVDDNAVNLTVAEGLLEPLKMKVMTAESGKEAIEMLRTNHFDMILMDHMMPEMDGVEATHIIRERYREYEDIPIIALTANAIGDARIKFLEAGLNDFIAKPIEVRNLLEKVRDWLPPEKIRYLTDEEIAEVHHKEAAVTGPDNIPLIGDLDTESAISMIGSRKVFWNILKEYHRVMTAKASAIKSTYEAKDWPSYTIEVHALKSSSRQIGATELSDMAAALENASKEQDTAFIEAHHETMLDRYLSYKPLLDPLFIEKAPAADLPLIDPMTLSGIFARLLSAAEDLDLDAMEEVAAELDQYSYPDDQAEYALKLKEAVGNIDPDSCASIISSWKEVM
ncbi:Signal transduction histidine kinase [Lachnospiraceae bacterium XBB2008]|nr:Signal transduction histidine kinase [Lachnospiraceae bacterium XBB2008]